jgi:hypothetical protein
LAALFFINTSGVWKMAQGLKIGDIVTVRKEIRLKRVDPAYKRGLKRLKPGQVGEVIDRAEGRSVVVEFNGTPVTLASQRFELANPPASPKPENAGEAPSDQVEPSAPTARGIPDEFKLFDYNNPDFITAVANKLLMMGGLEPDPDMVVVQIRLSDLPAQIRKHAQALMRDKLALGPQVRTRKPRQKAPQPVKTPGKRGRPKTRQP